MDDRLFVLKLSAWLEAHLRDGNHGPDLARASGYSDNRLRQKFYNVTGETPLGYLRKRRLTEAAKDLMKGMRIVDVSSAYGYSSQDNFSTAFKSLFGLTPGELQSMDGKYRAFLTRMKEPLNIMELTNLKQPPLCTTLMGSVKGASDFLELDWSVPALFGYSGHAFMIQIHEDICPSGPYTWKTDQLFMALRNMGVRKAEEISLVRGASPAELVSANERLRAHLDAGKPAMLVFLENQLVVGYDQHGFLFLLPWNCAGTELKSLSFSSWGECLDKEGWACFALFERESLVADKGDLLRSALAMALRMRKAPEEFRGEGCEAGDAAWGRWIECVDRGLGTSHGHWWNGMVWKECRQMASSFFDEVGPVQASPETRRICAELSSVYRDCAAQLDIAKEKACPAADQKKALERGRELDARAAADMAELLPLL